MKASKLVAIAACVYCVGLGISPRPAEAVVSVFELKDATRDTGWAILFDDAQVTNPTFAGMAGGTYQGKLSMKKVFKDVKPIDIQFIELPRDVSADDNFGLRITLNETIMNMSGADWTGFKLELIDTNPVLTGAENDSVSGAHPGFAHFHNLAPDGAQAFPPFKLKGPKNPPKIYELVEDTGRFKNGETRDWTGIGIHQIHEKAQHRNFILRETPTAIPEPATFALVGTGILALAFCVRRAARRRLRGIRC